MKYIIKTRAERLKFQKTELFSKLRKLKTSMGLNSIWSVGSLMNLCQKSKADNFYEWENYYFKSGKKRNGLVKRMTPEKQRLMNTYFLNEEEMKDVKTLLSFKERTINMKHGRKLEELFEMGEMLYEEWKKHGYEYISINDCVNFIYISVVDVAWMGYAREKNTIAQLHKKFHWLSFRKSLDKEDIEFAVDYKIVRAGKLLGAIQIKSEKELRKPSKGLKKGKQYPSKNVRRAIEKSKVFAEKENVPVLFVYAEEHGKIVNKNVIRQIYKLCA